MTTWAAFLTDDIAERRIRASSVAAVLSGVLHAGLIGAALAELPWNPTAASERGIDVTVELAPRIDEASATTLDALALTPDPAPASHLLLSESVPGDPPPGRKPREAMLSPEVAAAASDPAVEAPPDKPEAEAALALPPDAPSLEKSLPPVDAPPSIDAHDFARAKPPAPHPPTPQRAQTAAVQPPPVKRPAPPQAKPGAASGSAGPAPSAALKSDHAQRKSEEDYFYQLVRRISQYRFFSRAQDNVARGLVVTRMTIARDGRLLDVALLKSSGVPSLDQAVVETIRQASPFAPLPAELSSERRTFVVPINYTRER
jgi:TonB family protein